MTTAPPLFVLLAATLALVATAEAASVVNIQSYGQDGNTTYYQVQCSDKSVGSVSVSTSPDQVCSTPARKEAQCRPVWDVQRAAAHACR